MNIRYLVRSVITSILHNITKIKMSMFRILWLRRLIRRRTQKIPEDRALLWKKRLSVTYMLLSWNAVGLIVYMLYKGKADWARDYKSEEYMKLTPAQQWSQTLGIQKAKVIRFSGTNVTSYEVDNKSTEKTEQFKNINDLKN